MDPREGVDQWVHSIAVPLELAPLANDGMERLPVSRGLELVIVASVERRYRLVEGPAVALPKVPVVSVTEKLPPTIALDGGLLTR
jgi:hypothetical protein